MPPPTCSSTSSTSEARHSENPLWAARGTCHRRDMETMSAPTLVTPDLADERVVAQMWQVRERSEAASRVLPHRMTLSEFAEEARYAFPGERNETAAVVLDGAVIAQARIWFPERDNLGLCWSELHVDPAHCGRGAGSALTEWLEARARANGRSVHAVEIAVPVGTRDDHPARRFAERRGYSVASIEIVRRLELPVSKWPARSPRRLGTAPLAGTVRRLDPPVGRAARAAALALRGDEPAGPGRPDR